MLPVLHGERLRLRPLGVDDDASLLALFGDDRVTRFWGFETIRTRSQLTELVASIRDGAAQGILFQWGIETAGNDGIIGAVTLADIDRVHFRAELGIALRPDAQGQGFAREAVRTVLRHAFGGLALHRIIADVDPRNRGAISLLKDLGFRREGRLRQHYRHQEEWQDGILYGLLATDWSDALNDGATDP
jgi:[ribosomal protein S5]-alanine N-acetyltransferase